MPQPDKTSLTERDICTKFITPAVTQLRGQELLVADERRALRLRHDAMKWGRLAVALIYARVQL